MNNQKLENSAENIELLKKIFYYINNGIEYEDKVIKFSILDYYCLTSYDPEKLGKLASRLGNKALGSGTKLLNILRNPNDEVTCNINRYGSLTINGYTIERETIIDIYNYLGANNIKQTNPAMDIAISRYAKELPILPLKEKAIVRKIIPNNLPK